jgi:hypothetical protein
VGQNSAGNYWLKNNLNFKLNENKFDILEKVGLSDSNNEESAPFANVPAVL